ncbi:MAG: deoxyhypusine synthase [Deltaproteobacteria bacterium 37-65-8]|nr:deoxyhypusine synthase [Deltaproteobacteria bacterium]OYV98370.1 MAG: deoxyhypusine synthase [Deltaproteobacteria bacterium 37-65-8]HQT98285.1 deoxyhypusine synthase [Thermodesulfobacteriota bacterium]
MAKRSRYLSGARILPPPVGKRMPAAELIEKTFLAYNAGRLREGARLLSERMLKPDVTVGLSLTGALTPAGLGVSCIVPLLKAGFVDWVVSTGANLYHDAHFGLGLPMHAGSPFLDDRVLRDEGVVRIYDVLFDYEVLLDTDAFFRQVLDLPEFQAAMGTAEFHYRLGRYMAQREKALGQGEVSVLAAAWRYGVPVYTSSPGDSSIGMNVAAMRLGGRGVTFDVSLDVNETAAIVYDAKRRGGKSAVWILGGGSPKNFMLQTEPQIQEVLGLDEKGHDYFLQVTDARPDTGGLSGATPSEAVSWGKVDPDKLPDTVVCYLDSTVALPLLCAFAFDRVGKRTRRRLYDRREEMLSTLEKAYRKAVNAAGVTKKRKVARKK